MTSPVPIFPLHASDLGRLRGQGSSPDYACLVSSPGPRTRPVTSRWPLILFLHGVRERGTAVSDVVRQGLPRLLSDSPDLTPDERTCGQDVADRFAVVAPQCPPYEVWDDARLLALLDRITGELNIDPARVYLTGLSMGGFGAWSLGLRHPERFAALVPICGGGRIADIATGTPEQRRARQALGVWAFHGARDRVVPLEESQRMIEALQRAEGRDVKLTVYPEGEHDAWTATYTNAELYAWLLAHSR